MKKIDKIEKNIDWNEKNIDKKKDIWEKISNLINKILSEPNEKFWDRINHVINKVFDSIPNDISKNKELQKEIFDKIYNFLNKTFKDIEVKKLYNNIPNIDFKKYADKDLWNQFINNIYGKERKIFYKNEIQWGSCHHWTIFFKKLFEKLEEKWFDIKSRIITYTLPWWHSAVILNFLWEKYFADLYWTEELYLAKKIDKMVINTFTGLNKVAGMDVCSNFSFNKEKDKDRWINYYKDIDGFVFFIKNRKNNTATIEFKPKLETGKDWNTRIELAKKYIALIINWEIKKYKINAIDIPIFLKNDPRILDFILKNICWTKEAKWEIAKYFEMIRNKINPEKIYEIFNDKTIK